jgi:hypothetical protein
MRKTNGRRASWKPPAPLESDDQIAVVYWAHHHHDVRLHSLLHIPNQKAYRITEMGIIKGVSDLFLPIPSRGFIGFWQELKRITGGNLSEDQSDWLKLMESYGHACAVSVGYDDAISDLSWYLEL